MISLKSNFKIEKNFPIPKRTLHYSEFPFGEMEVGDSFFVSKKRYQKTSLTSLRMYIYNRIIKFIAEEGKPWKFSSSFDRQNDGVRIFRVE